MAGFNKIFLMGNLTRDPQLSYTPSQTAVVDFGIATNRRWTSQDGSQREDTCFVDCRAFGRLAENINKYLNKGRAVFVEGRLTFRAGRPRTAKSEAGTELQSKTFSSCPAPRPVMSINQANKTNRTVPILKQNNKQNRTIFHFSSIVNGS